MGGAAHREPVQEEGEAPGGEEHGRRSPSGACARRRRSSRRRGTWATTPSPSSWTESSSTTRPPGAPSWARNSPPLSESAEREDKRPYIYIPPICWFNRILIKT